MDRAAVFTSSPQTVEVYEGGGWLPASMLGWRHEVDGSCAAWVRVELAGVVEDAWVDLTRLRLPEVPSRHLAPAPGLRTSTGGADSDPATGPGGTQQLAPVRAGGSPPLSRRVRPSGGRRRAPETGELPAAGPAPSIVVPRSAGPVPGRHRAPADLGRHRAADTGVLIPARAGGPPPSGLRRADDIAGGDGGSAPPPRSELPPAGPVVRAPGGRDPEVEGLTRPMRLDHVVGSVRRSRHDALSV